MLDLSELPIVCKYCREPLRWTPGGYLEVETGRLHFRDDQCPVEWALGWIQRAQRFHRSLPPEVTQGKRRMDP